MDRNNFLKIVTFKRTIRKFLNMLAVHIEGTKHPPYAYLTHFFHVNVPLNIKLTFSACPTKFLICWGSKAEAKNWRALSTWYAADQFPPIHAAFLAPWPAAESILIRSGQRLTPFLLRGGEGWTRHNF
jgi:hypothetical protein